VSRSNRYRNATRDANVKYNQIMNKIRKSSITLGLSSDRENLKSEYIKNFPERPINKANYKVHQEN